jgi:hypothetical protein
MNRGAGIGVDHERVPVAASEGKTRPSCAGEIKAASWSIARAGVLFGKQLVARLLGLVASGGIIDSLARGVGSVVCALSPALSIVGAALSIRKAVRTCRDGTATTTGKSLAVTGAVINTAFIANPVVSVVSSIGMAAINLARALRARGQHAEA